MGEGGSYRWRWEIGGLAEKLADLLVHVTQEVHVWRSPAGALVLDQEVPEYQLGSVFLFHNHQLRRRGEREEWERGRCEGCNLYITSNFLMNLTPSLLYLLKVWSESQNNATKWYRTETFGTPPEKAWWLTCHRCQSSVCWSTYQSMDYFTSTLCIKVPGLINLFIDQLLPDSYFYFHSFSFALFCYRLKGRSFVKMDRKELQ